MQRVLIDVDHITRTHLETTIPYALEDGQARLRLRRFALTANNVTYAASGHAIGYWKFFPTAVDRMGQVPVWGFADVVESRSDAAPVGMRLYGFYPMAEELVMTPAQAGGALVDAASHRADLPPVYNQYIPAGPEDANKDNLRAILQPLLVTSYLLSDWLEDNDYFGAKQIIVGSASSKTGLGLCGFLAEQSATGGPKIIGLTSDANRAFVHKLKYCDRVLSYDDIDAVPLAPSVYVDMAGNAAVKFALHTHLGQYLKHSCAVGLSHWDQFAPPKDDMPGPKPEFFFAPAQIEKRRKDWPPGEVEKRIGMAWTSLAKSASAWMDVQEHAGLDAAIKVYDALASGRANPKHGHIVTLA